MEFGCVLRVQSGAPDKGNFNDNFVEALITTPTRVHAGKKLVYFNLKDYQNYKSALARKSIDLEVTDYLKMLGWMGKPGFQFGTNKSPQECHFSASFSIAKEKLSWSIVLQFYIANVINL